MTERVLIVDDEENIRRMTRLTLEAAGYEVGEASSGHEGLEKYGADPNWDVILLDQRMPGIDGLETLRRLKDFNASVRVVMVTAYASIELAVDAMKLGATDFIRKPMTPQIVRGAVAAAIAKTARLQTEPVQPEEPTTGRPKMETLTLNGFEILRPTSEDAVITQPDEHAFIVIAPDGARTVVIVEIASAAIDFVARITHRQLPADNSFWESAAERLLTDYLWDEGKVPPEGKLALRDLDREQMLTAERWTA